MSNFGNIRDAGSCVARQGAIWQPPTFNGKFKPRTKDEVVSGMKSRILGLKNLLRNHGHELILAAVLTLVAIVALMFSGFGFG